MTNEFQDSKREQTSLLAPLERRALHWLAARMPSWTTPDHLTLLGFASLLTAGVFYGLSCRSENWLYAVSVCLLLNWFGDSLDGTLARYRQHLRPRYGYYVDHVVDTSGTLVLLLGMGISPYMTGRVALTVLVAYFMVSINSYLATFALGTFKISFWKFSPTELRLLLIIGNFVLLVHPNVKLSGFEFSLFDVGGVVSMLILLLVFGFHAIANTARLYRLEPPARRS